MSKLNLIQPRYIPSLKTVCGFTNRYGGASLSPFDSMNLGLKTTDNQSHVFENRKTNIERFDDCTVCNNTLYYSHRRDGNRSGRMMGFIMLKEE